MPRKGMRTLCFHSPRTLSFSISRDSLPSSTPSRLTPRRSFSESMADQIIDSAAAIITKWNPEASGYANVTSLFYESKIEARRFMECVKDLQKVMHLLVSEDSGSEKLIEAQNLMQIAMKRLQKEFYQILSMNRAHLDPESVSTRSSRASARSSTSEFEDDDSSDEIRAAGDSISDVEEVSSIAMADLKSIADCMISSGYAKECIHIYKIIRKSIIDEAIYRLGIEQISSSRINKLEWNLLDLKIKSWLGAVKISMRTLFHGERILCDHVFSASDSIRESCFTDISKEAAVMLFAFPDLVAKYKKFPREAKMFRVLDMYTAISEYWKDIETIFSFESTSAVRVQALNSLIRLSESTRSSLSDFESAIQKDSLKLSISGGSLHPLTLKSMNHLSLLADYSDVLADILADWSPQEKSSLPRSYFDSPDSQDSSAPVISLRMAWMILVLLCKLDSKAKHYKSVSLSYLFLANNLQHIVSRVRTSNLQYLLGFEWISKHDAKVRLFASNYEKLVWGEVFASLPEDPTAVISPGEAKEYFRKFNLNFEDVYWKQKSCVVPDHKLRDDIKVSISRKLMPVYREFYSTHRLTVGGEIDVKLFVRFAPEDVENYLSDLFFGEGISGNSSVHSSSSSPRRYPRSPLRK